MLEADIGSVSLSAASNIGGRIPSRSPAVIEVAARRDALLTLEPLDLARIALLKRAQIDSLRAFNGLQLALLFKTQRLDAVTVGPLILLELNPAACLAALRGCSKGVGAGARRLSRRDWQRQRKQDSDEGGSERRERWTEGAAGARMHSIGAKKVDPVPIRAGVQPENSTKLHWFLVAFSLFCA